MLARLCLVLGFLFAGDSALPNGIRIYDCAGKGCDANSFEVTVGYRSGAANAIPRNSALGPVIAEFLKLSASARAMAVAAYGAGGEFEFISDLDRTAIHIKMPVWARPMIADSIARFLAESPIENPELVDRALSAVRQRMPPANDPRFIVEEQLRAALLGPGTNTDIASRTHEAVDKFFAQNFGTDQAFVVMNADPPPSLQNLERRTSTTSSGTPTAETGKASSSSVIHLQTDLDEGAALIGVPVPSVYYRNWYAFLVLDRLIQQVLPEKPRTILPPSMESYFYQLELKVPSGQTAAAVDSEFLRRLEPLEYMPASAESLDEARNSAIQYLQSEPIQRWYLSLGLAERRVEGIDWVQSFTADDMRAAVRDFFEAKPVIAGWSPRPRTLRLDTELLSVAATPAAIDSSPSPPAADPLGPLRVAPFPPHSDPPIPAQAPVRLDSGVSVTTSSAFAVFVAPDLLRRFDRLPDAALMQSAFGPFRANRILVLAPAESLDRVKQQWARFQGNPQDRTAVTISGNVTSADIPALYLLKMMLDRRLMESGMWDDIQLEIQPSQGSALSIHANEFGQSIVRGWMRQIASQPISDADMEWAREAATHRLPIDGPDLQSLLWVWNPGGVLTGFRQIPAAQLQDVARFDFNSDAQHSNRHRYRRDFYRFHRHTAGRH